MKLLRHRADDDDDEGDGDGDDGDKAGRLALIGRRQQAWW
jgi:hypothetical protein